MLDPQIAAHYALGLEDGRLFAEGRPRLEYLRTLELLDRLLPAPPARLLDVGGGSGVYAAALMARGYDVQLIDPVPLHVEQARARGVDAIEGDARDLSAHRGFDAVLLLGPLYHLVERTDRVLALTEARRAARPEAVVAAAGISRFASLVDGHLHDLLGDPVFRPIVEGDLRDGQHRNETGRPNFFTTAYFHHPDELRQEAADAGLRDVRLLAIEGVGWLNEASDIERQLFAARATEAEPALAGVSAHLLVTGLAPPRQQWR